MYDVSYTSLYISVPFRRLSHYILMYWMGLYPLNPSACISLGTPSLNVLAQPGCVWIRTLTASMGAKAISAKNSALALAAR